MVSPRVAVQPQLYDFARERSGIESEEWERRFPHVSEWRSGQKQPTFKQLQTFAHQTHTPLGYLLLEEPPNEPLPIADFRTTDNREVKPDANLLDCIYAAQARQEWYRDHQLLNNEERVEWVEMIGPGMPPKNAARVLHFELTWGAEERNRCRTWDAALTSLREAAEQAGALVMIAGYAGRSTRRKLDPQVFRGFALADQFAPVVFINGADAKSAQIFTLVHELAHLMRGSTGLSDLDPDSDHDIERWCNSVAAEFLVPEEEFIDQLAPGETPEAQLQALASHFKVSTLTIIGRFRELGHIDWPRYFELKRSERERIAALQPEEKSSGGNYNNSRPVQVSKRFATDLIASMFEGTTTFTEAARLIGTSKESTLRNMGQSLGVL